VEEDARVEAPLKWASNPLQVGPALQMAAVFQIVLFAVNGARQYFGERGLLASGAVLGLTDVDALTISMTKTAAGSAQSVAAQAIAIGILANCLLKCGLAVVVGMPRFRSVVGAVLATMAAAIAISLAIIR
jgi:uncharacterized membrane protein (DUF4010 family)